MLGSHAAIGDEPDPTALEQAAVALGWRTAFPRVAGTGPLAFHAARKADLAPGFRGIPEPRADAPNIVPDVLLVPLVGADLAGNRLGQGGGHYDRTLASLRARKPEMGRRLRPTLAIGLAWDLQLLPCLPARGWDEPLDAIATPTAFRRLPVRAIGLS